MLMPQTNIESDPFFVQLTDALRAGPASPQWHEAISALRQRGAEGGDEFQLLTEARAALESGREYRAVRAGPGFTRKLLSEIEEGANVRRTSGIPTATVVAIICGLFLVVAAGYVIYRLAPRELTTQQLVADLDTRSQRFFDTLSTASFAEAIPDGWKTIGSLRLTAAAGLRPAPDQENKGLGGGVVRIGAIPGAQAFAADVTVHAGAPAGAVLLEAFVSTDPNFSADKGTSSRDLVWQLRSREQQVLLSGSGQHIAGPTALGADDTIRIIVDQKVAIVETVAASGGKTQQLWTGAHDLGDGPRYIGVRFLQTGAAARQDLSVQQIKITTTNGG